MNARVSLDDVRRASERIAPYLGPTPLIHSPALSEAAGVDLWLKLECRQRTGSFKPRGALNKLLSLPAGERRGLVAASAGNHALGVAFACAALGIDDVDLFVQRTAAPAKLAKLRRAPLRLHLVGDSFDETQALAFEHLRATGGRFVSAYDDEAVVAGQGSVGLEIAEQLDAFDAVVVPTGGGALSAGIAVALKALRPGVRVIGVNAEASPSALESFRQGRALETYEHAPTLAHGLAGGYGRVPFEIARGVLDEIALASEREIKAAIAALVDAEQVLAEASGAAGLAAVLGGRIAGLRGRVVVVISGGNIDAATLRDVLRDASNGASPAAS
jgi:threonine dehydratase